MSKHFVGDGVSFMILIRTWLVNSLLILIRPDTIRAV